MTPKELIAKGIEVIERDGWYQGALYRGSIFETDADGIDYEKARTEPVCMIGSLYRGAAGTCEIGDMPMDRSVEITELVSQAADLLLATIDSGSTGFIKSVAEFNDRNTTTKEDVLLMMKRAASDSEG